MMKKMTLFIALWVLCLTVSAQQLTVQVNGGASQTGTSLGTAIANTGVALGSITQLEVTAGDFTTADWNYLKNNSGNLNTLAPPCDQGYSNNRIYVNASATGTADGKAWATAYTDLQDAIDKAASCNSLTEIWVAGGTYKPSKKPRNADRGTPITTNDARDVTFHLIDGVKLYGGFAGTEAALADRDLSANTTTLSGDIGTAGDNDNAYHVVLSVSDGATTVLDGFTITGANANGSGIHIIVETKAIYPNSGGGMFNEASSPSVTNVTFSGNTASNGGGMYNYFYSSPSITNVTFSGNTATNGGGMYNDSSSPSITNVILSGNTANLGGGMYTLDSSPKIYNSIFWGNKQGTDTNVAGADIYNDSSSPTVEYCLTQENSTYSSGTGIINNQDPLFVDASNPAGADGIFGTADDGLRLQAGSPAINAGNNAPSGVTMPSTDITGAARIQGGTVDMGAYEITLAPPCTAPTNLTATNITLTTADLGFTSSGSEWEIEYGASGFTQGNGTTVSNVTTNPYSLTGLTSGTAYDFYVRELGCTGVIWSVKGTFTTITPPPCDQGYSNNRIYVNASATGTADGKAWATAYTDLQDAIDKAVSCSNLTEIWVAGGTYKPSKKPRDTDRGTPLTTGDARDVSFHLIDGVKLYGGFAGTEAALADRDLSTNTTTLSGDIGTAGDNTDNAYHIVVSVRDTNATVLDGFTITGGNANLLTYRYITVEAERIASSGGSGMFNESSSPSITNVIFSGNTASFGGSGMVNNNFSSPSIMNVTFNENTASHDGGGMFNESSSPSMTNVTFSRNTASHDGGGMYNYNSSPSMTNVTFSGNTASHEGGGMFNNTTSSPKIYNSIFWGNKKGGDTATAGADIKNDSSSPTVEYCLTQVYGTDGTNGNIVGQDPLFVDATNPAGADGIFGTADDGLRLQVGSPAINAGNNAPPGVTMPTTDITGAARIQGGTVDMGAYEITPPPCTAPTNLTATNITYTSADLGFTSSGSEWEIEYGASGFTQGNGTVVSNITTNPYSLTGLTSGTAYDFYVREVCAGTGGALWSAKRTFTTHAITIQVNGGASSYTGATLEDAIANAGVALGSITRLEVTAGDFTTADWNYLKSKAGNTTGLTALANFTITDNINTVADIPNTNETSPYFRINGITTVSIAKVNSIGVGAFYDRKALTSVSFPQATSIGNYAFSSCNALTSVSFPQATSIGKNAFIDCWPLATISFPQATSIEEGAFANCRALTSVSFPQATSIGDYAFYRCSALTTLKLGTTVPTVVGTNTFKDTPTPRNLVLVDATGTPLTAGSAYNTAKAAYDPDGDGLWYGWTIAPACMTLSIAQTNVSTTGGNDGSLTVTATDGTAPYTYAWSNGETTQTITGLTAGTYTVTVTDAADTACFANTSATITQPAPPVGGIYYVTQTGAGSMDGTSWANASNDIQAMINAASSGEKIFVAKGTYKPEYKADDVTGAKTLDNRDNAFVLKDGVKLYGGFAGTETSEDNRIAIDGVNKTILSGDVGTAGDNTDNTYHVVISVSDTDTTVFDGFTITDGNANGTGNIAVEYKNLLQNQGGGMYNVSSAPSVRQVVFLNNSAAKYGGGIYNIKSSTVLYDVVFYQNQAADQGGAMYNIFASTPVITNVVFSSNTATKAGGAIVNNSGASPIITNTTFNENSTSNFGGAIDNGASSPTINNCIFWNNTVANRTDLQGADITSRINSNPTVEYSVLQENNLFSGGTGNLTNQDPLFVDATNPAGVDGIFHTADDGLKLQCVSPAINVGNNSPSGVTMPSTDITGAARIQGGTVDMGAYESTKGTAALATDITGTSLPTAAGMYYSEHTITDGSIKHYCTCNNELLLSLGDNSNVPDDGVSIKIGSTGATYYAANTGFITNSNGGAIINRTWNAIPTTQPSKAVEVRYYYTAAEFTALNTAIMSNGGTALTGVEQIQFYKVTKSGAHLPVADIATNEVILLNNGTTPSTTEWQTGSFNSNHYAAFKVSSFSGGGGGSATAGQALPVEMIYFTATKEGDNVRLDWATASEVNNEGFEVERSTDGLAFEKIGDVRGNGTTTEEMTYNFTDTDAVSGVVYYRLKQMDYDGAYEYSNIISIRIDGASLLSVYPNPTTDVLHISKKSSYSIINSQGQEVARGNDNSIDVSRLPLGLYIIRLDNSVVKRFIKM